MTAALLLALAAAGAAANLGGGHAPDAGAPAGGESRVANLDEMWRRRLLPPDQRTYSPDELALLQRMRRSDEEAIEHLKRLPGGWRPWAVRLRVPGAADKLLTTKEGFERYLFSVSQDAVKLFERKGAPASRVFKLADAEGKRLFDARGRLTEAGETVYRRARLNLEVYWKGPSGELYGTRRPQAAAR